MPAKTNKQLKKRSREKNNAKEKRIGSGERRKRKWVHEKDRKRPNGGVSCCSGTGHGMEGEALLVMVLRNIDFVWDCAEKATEWCFCFQSVNTPTR